MEKLLVKDFLVIKSAEFDVGRINLIIGSQATGKSILAKLLYFFREFLDSTYIESIAKLEVKKDIEKSALSDFEKYFPKYAWESQLFSIEYSINNILINLSRQKTSDGKTILKFNYSENLSSHHQKLKSLYRKKREESEKILIKEGYVSHISIWEIISKCIQDKEIDFKFIGIFKKPIFIPAARSFFANLQKNTFSFWASKIEIDPFIISFGSQYEEYKYLYRIFDYNKDRMDIDDNGLISIEKIKGLIESILVGKYKYEDDQDWIEYKGTRINLSNASSGQQEALPMLMVMYMWSSLRKERSVTLFIEEPEAHLFPVSQKHIVSLIALIHNHAKHDFVITTHSPYILTAINNMILANDVLQAHGTEKLSKIDPDFSISYEDVRAYTIEDGILVSILDDENRLIGTNIIDSVSDEFAEYFDTLIEIQAGD